MNNFNFITIITLVASYVLAVILIPKIRWIAKARNLTDSPDNRSSHKDSIPTMAGVAFFLIILFISSIINPWDIHGVGIHLISALALMFAVGIKDDLMISTPRAKIGGEILAVLFILFCNCLQVYSLEGFLGIHQIPTFVSYAFIILLILTIVNSFNMIDGIDGLASSMGIVIFAMYGFIFYVLESNYYFLLCLCLIGMLLGYLKFNLSKTNKVFMGDTGSLIIGFCIGFLSLKFLSTDASLLRAHSFNPENNLIIIGAIFFIPLFDTLRVIGVRLLNKKSPFGSDNNHIHHILIRSGLSHFKASLLLCFINVIIATILILLSPHFTSYQMVLTLLVCFMLLTGIFYKLNVHVKMKLAT